MLKTYIMRIDMILSVPLHGFRRFVLVLLYFRFHLARPCSQRFEVIKAIQPFVSPFYDRLPGDISVLDPPPVANSDPWLAAGVQGSSFGL